MDWRAPGSIPCAGAKFFFFFNLFKYFEEDLQLRELVEAVVGSAIEKTRGWIKNQIKD